MELIWTDLAKASIADIATYVEEYFSRNVAEKVVLGIYKSVQPLKDAPNIGRQALEFETYGEVRCLIHKQNQIYYLIEDNKIYIMIVWDGRQDPEKLLDLMLDFFSKRISETKQ